MDEFPSGGGGMGGAAPAEEDFSSMPIEDRLKSKVWKARVSAYEELVRSFARSPSESDPIFKPYTRSSDAAKAMVLDSNAVAQEKGVDAVRALLEFGGKAAATSTREDVMPAIVDKCLGSARAGTKKAALEVTLLFIEMGDVMGSEGVVLDLLKGTEAKQPKTVAGSIAALKEAVRLFGPKQVSPKHIVKKLPDMFGHSDKTARAEASGLAVELHRWIGAALEPTLASLKDIQAKELRAQFEKAGDAYTRPERHLVSQRAAAEAAQASAAGGAGGDAGDAGGGADEAEAVDPLEFAEPVDPLKSSDWPQDMDEMLVSKKWQERKETLENAAKVLQSTPKILYTPSLDTLVDNVAERLKKDININVVLTACSVLTLLAKGLRSNFAKHKEKVLPVLLEKLKERKESTVKVLAECCDAVFQTVSFADVLEDIFAATKHKNPAVKTESIRFLVRCLAETRTMPAKGDIKPIAESLLAAMSDGSADVRDAGAQGLGTLQKLIGERAMTQYLESLDDIKKAKVAEQSATATVKVKAATAPARAAPAAKPAGPSAGVKPRAPPVLSSSAAKKPLPAVHDSADKENAPPSPSKPVAAKAPPARLLAKKPAGAAPPSAAARPIAKPAAAAAAPPKAAPAATEPVKYRFSAEDAEARAEDLIPEAIRTLLASSNWKERLQGATDLNTWLEAEVETAECEVIVRALAKKPGWKESNFQVLGEVYKTLRKLAEESPSFGRASVALSVQPLCDKLGDIKLKAPAGETLTVFAESTSLGFVLNQAMGPLKALKAPKAIADSLLWVDQALLDFGTSGVDVRGVIDLLLTCLKSANAAVRTNATQVIGTLARFLGSALTAFLGELNPQLRASVDAEIEKAAANPAPAPTRFAKEAKAPAGGKAAGGGGGGASAGAATAAAGPDEDALDALIPRVDLDKLIDSAVVAKLGHSNWKERKEGLEEIQAILEANKRLKPNMNELAGPLKARYADSNMAVRTLALDVIGRIAAGMNKGFEPHARAFVPSVVQVLADAKAPIRASAAAALTAMAEQVGASPLIAGMGSVLDSQAANPMLRQDLFTWLAAWFDEHPPEKPMDLTPLALPAVQSLDDKLAAVRKAAQACLPYIIARAGYKFVLDQTNSLKAASRNSVVPLIDAAKAQAAAKAKAAAPAPAAPAAAAPAVARPGAGVVRKPSAIPPTSSTAAPSSPKRSQSPAPSAAGSRLVRPGGVRPPSAVGRALKAPSSVRASMALTSDDVTEANETYGGGGTKSRLPPKLGLARAAPSSSSSGASKSVPFVSSDAKFKALRERKEARGTHWISAEGTPRPELIEVLRGQCDHHLSVDLTDSMFSKDHNAERDFLSALTLLSDFISSPAFAEEEFGLAQSEAVSRVVANSDLIFKYVAIRLTDNNTSISLKCLDVIDHLVDLLRAEQYHMSDYEASAILPCLVAKFGDAKVAFRDRIRNIFRRLVFIFPPSKLLAAFVENGLPSKNARTRAECLGELGFLFSKNGLQVCTPSRTLPVIAKSIADRDANVRTAALLALGEAYKIVGDDVYKLVGTLSAKDMSLLEERLKRTSVPGGKAVAAPAVAGPRSSIVPPSARSGIPSRMPRPSSVAAPSGIQPPKSRLPSMAGVSGIAKPGHRSISSTSEIASRAAPVPSTRFDEAEEDAPLDGEDVDEEADFTIEQTVNEILSSDAERSVAALKEIVARITEEAPGLPQHADQLAIVISKQLHRAFTLDDAPDNARLKKYLLVAGTKLFDLEPTWDENRCLGSYLSRPAVVSLLTELLQRLIETSATTDETLMMQGKYLNATVLRSFSACNLNTLFGACLQMLSEATEDLSELTGAVLEKRSKFAELIVKCLWKVARRLPDSLREGRIEPQQLLLDVEKFLQVVPPSEWRRRDEEGVALGEVPLRTVKIILTNVSEAFGEESLAMLDLVPEPEQSQVYGYLVRFLNKGEPAAGDGGDDDDVAIVDDVDEPTPRRSASNGNGQARQAVVTPPTSPSRKADTTLSPRSTSDDDAANAELRSIFDRIAIKEESRAAIRALYEFQKKYPSKAPSIERSLQTTGPIFQRYIKRALANHAAEDDDAPAHTAVSNSADSPSTRTSMTNGSVRDSVQSALSARGSSHLSTGSASALQLGAAVDGLVPSAPSTPNKNDQRLAALRAKFAKSGSAAAASAHGA